MKLNAMKKKLFKLFLFFTFPLWVLPFYVYLMSTGIWEISEDIHQHLQRKKFKKLAKKVIEEHKDTLEKLK